MEKPSLFHFEKDNEEQKKTEKQTRPPIEIIFFLLSE